MKGGEFDEAGRVATELKKALAEHGYDGESARRAAVVAFEAEMNVIIHAVAGTLSYSVEGGEVEIIVQDMGPGIPDVEKAMRKGFSTAPEWARQKGWGSGLGLPNIKDNCDGLVIETEPGVGTTLIAKVKLRAGQGERV